MLLSYGVNVAQWPVTEGRLRGVTRRARASRSRAGVGLAGRLWQTRDCIWTRSGRPPARVPASDHCEEETSAGAMENDCDGPNFLEHHAVRPKTRRVDDQAMDMFVDWAWCCGTIVSIR